MTKPEPSTTIRTHAIVTHLWAVVSATLHCWPLLLTLVGILALLNWNDQGQDLLTGLFDDFRGLVFVWLYAFVGVTFLFSARWSLRAWRDGRTHPVDEFARGVTATVIGTITALAVPVSSRWAINDHSPDAIGNLWFAALFGMPVALVRIFVGPCGLRIVDWAIKPKIRCQRSSFYASLCRSYGSSGHCLPTC